MLLCISSILDGAALAEVQEALGRVRFVDGARTAGWQARRVKANLQAEPGDAIAGELGERIGRALLAHELFVMAARPRRLGPVLLSRYEPGMGYGTHVDNALMGGLRVDLSFTLFLADPASYDGGALVIDSPGGEQAIRLEAGALVLYPSTTLHRVAEVTRGARLAAVGWVESLVRDPARRELLLDLDTARRALFQAHGPSRELDLIAKTHANLLRMWAET